MSRWHVLWPIVLAGLIVMASGRSRVAGPSIEHIDKVTHFAVYGLLGLWTLIVLFPLYWVLVTSLKEPVDAFFDGVMVMTDDERLRRNRVALLAQLQQTMNRIADISKLAVER